MLPLGHVAFTLGAFNALQHAGFFEEADLRGAALASLAPDLLDKPLAVFVLRRAHASLLFGHTLLGHLLMWAFILAFRRRWVPYAMAGSGHLVQDRMWGFPDTFLWPFRGWRFHQWRHVGSPSAFIAAYRDIVRSEPKLVIFDILGIIILAWTIVDRKWYQPSRLWNLLRSGREEG